MINIDGTRISITRGDCEPFTITFTGEDIPQDGTKVLFSVKKTADQQMPFLEKELEITDGKVDICITNDDTKRLPFGDYAWDIRFPDYYGTKEPYTPMEPAVFSVMKVIGNV